MDTFMARCGTCGVLKRYSNGQAQPHLCTKKGQT